MIQKIGTPQTVTQALDWGLLAFWLWYLFAYFECVWLLVR